MFGLSSSVLVKSNAVDFDIQRTNCKHVFSENGGGNKNRQLAKSMEWVMTWSEQEGWSERLWGREGDISETYKIFVVCSVSFFREPEWSVLFM